MVKAILIDSAQRQVREVEIAGLDGMQAAVGGYIEVAHEWDNLDTLYVDEEGFLKPQTHFFRIGERDQPFPGNGLVIGCDDEGDNADVKSTVDQVTKTVRFLDQAQMESWVKANASEPAIMINDEVVTRWGSFYDATKTDKKD